jgi:hypothetical protein
MSSLTLPIAALLSLVACTAPADDAELAERRKPRRPDAGVPAADAGAVDAGSLGGSGGTVSCYRQNSPSASCSAPQVCCFTNYSAQHNGECSSNACTWGTIRCDGPEDCGSGERCCSHAIVDPDEGLQGYMLACSASACGAAPLDYELCHPGVPCSNGKTCVTAYGNANDLPRSLYVCK